MLGSRWLAEQGTPVVFLHGLLGSQDDWAAPLAEVRKFQKICPLVIDLPYHASSQHIPCHGFADFRTQLHRTLEQQLGSRPFWLVGYSLGGRLVLDYTLNHGNPNLLGTLLEGANIGLKTEQERQARWQNDVAWANRFRTEPMNSVLEDWYRQPVFAHLTATQRQLLVAKRSLHLGANIAAMLEATSLAKQPYFGDSDWQKITFLIGERDHKFQQLALQHHLPYRLIAHAGHNAHWENPEGFIEQLMQLIRRENGSTPLP